MNVLQLDRLPQKVTDPAPPARIQSSANRKISCCYVNHTAQFQIIRAVSAASGFATELLERTVFPGAKICFEASLYDRLEVHSGSPMTSILSDTIYCHQLIHLENTHSPL